MKVGCVVVSPKGRRSFPDWWQGLRWAYVELALEEIEVAFVDSLVPWYVNSIRDRQTRRWKRCRHRPGIHH